MEARAAVLGRPVAEVEAVEVTATATVAQGAVQVARAAVRPVAAAGVV